MAYAADNFQCLLDSDLYLPESWVNDPARRKEAGMPDDVVYRKKTHIALEQIGRALRNGIRFSALTFAACLSARTTPATNSEHSLFCLGELILNTCKNCERLNSHYSIVNGNTKVQIT